VALGEAAAQHQQALDRRDHEFQEVQDRLVATQNELRSALQTLAQAQSTIQELNEQRSVLEARHKTTAAQLDDTSQQLQARTAELEAEHARRMDEQKQQEQFAKRLRVVYDQLVEQLQDDIQAETVTVKQNGDHLLVRIAGTATFRQGRATVRRQGRVMLQKMSRVLGEHPDSQLNVEGHTDAMPLNAELRQSLGTNWELSTARALYVIHYLRKLGIAPERLVAEGYGPYRPLVSNETPEGRTQNRRIEIIVRPTVQS
jgi:chemotaxis protein MotB